MTGLRINVLDHGYVQLVAATAAVETIFDGFVYPPRAHGNSGPAHFNLDLQVVRAARTSYDAAWRVGESESSDERLLMHLMRHKHTSPFEAPSLTLEVQAPLFVFREWHRHRTQSYSEQSARFMKLEPLYFQPEIGNLIARAYEGARPNPNKQATGIVDKVDEARLVRWLDRGVELQCFLEQFYQEGLEAGAPKELARYNMPVSHYSKMQTSANLLNWFRFLGLRLPSNVMEETRLCAQAVIKLVAMAAPASVRAFKKHWINDAAEVLPQ